MLSVWTQVVQHNNNKEVFKRMVAYGFWGRNTRSPHLGSLHTISATLNDGCLLDAQVDVVLCRDDAGYANNHYDKRHKLKQSPEKLEGWFV